MTNSIIGAQREAYRANLLKHGEGPKGTLQNDVSTQYLRFRLLLKEIAPHFSGGTTLHDLGSGLSDLHGYLIEAGLADTIIYSGTEIVDEMIEISRRKYPSVTLVNRDLREATVDEKYDFCVASGTFNLLGGVADPEWRELCFSLIEKMFDISKKGISFNVLTTYRTFSDETLCYFDPKDVFDFLTTRLSRFVIADAASPLYEVTFTVFRKEYMSPCYPGDAFQKYFR